MNCRLCYFFDKMCNCCRDLLKNYGFMLSGKATSSVTHYLKNEHSNNGSSFHGSTDLASLVQAVEYRSLRLVWYLVE